jgi:hypothetical protein
MCFACEEQEYFFRMWCEGFQARGQLPPGVTEQDLEAMGFELPAALRSKDGSGQPRKISAPPADAFACDSPDGE